MSDVRRVDRVSKVDYPTSSHSSKKSKESSSNENELRSKKSGATGANDSSNSSRIVKTKKSDSTTAPSTTKPATLTSKNSKYDNKLIIETSSTTRRVKNRSPVKSNSRSRSRVKNENNNRSSSRSRSRSKNHHSTNRTGNVKASKANARSMSRSPLTPLLPLYSHPYPPSRSRSRSRSVASNHNYSKDSKTKTKSKNKKQKQTGGKRRSSKTRTSPSPFRSPVSFERSPSPANSLDSRNSGNYKASKPLKSAKNKDGAKKKSEKADSNKSKSSGTKDKTVGSSSSNRADKKSSKYSSSYEKTSSKKSSSSAKQPRSPSLTPSETYHNNNDYDDASSIRSRDSSNTSANDYPNPTSYRGSRRSPYNSRRSPNQPRKLPSTTSAAGSHPPLSNSRSGTRFGQDLGMDNDDQPYEYGNRYHRPAYGGRYGQPPFNNLPHHSQNLDGYDKPMPYGANMNNRNQFYPPHLNHPYMSKYDGQMPPKYMNKYKNNRNYFQPGGHHHHHLPPPPHQMDPAQYGYDDNNYPHYYGNQAPSNPRFYSNNYNRFNPKMDNGHFGGPHYANQYGKQPYQGHPGAHPSAKKSKSELNTSANANNIESGSGDSLLADATNNPESGMDTHLEKSPPLPTIDPELTLAVTEITEAIAAASSAGKELLLTKEQQLILQKHELLVQQHQQMALKKQQQLANPQLASSAAAAAAANQANKKVPNYRLLGRNIFDTGVKQQFFKKRIKANTYYSRFIKQHPTTNLPLAFQPKSFSLAEDRQLEEKENKNNNNNESDGQITSSSSSTSSKTSTGSDQSDSDSGEIRKKKNKKRSKQSKKKKEKKLAKKLDKDNNGTMGTENKDQSKTTSSGNSSRSSATSSSSSSASSSSSDERNVKKKRSKHARANLLSFGGKDDYDSDGSMLDLRENLKPIGAYMKDRERLLDEMFRCIKGSKLQAMLPEIIKNKPFKEIRKRCLEVLDIMSKKRIGCLLADKQMMSSSGTDESSDEDDNSVKNLVQTSNFEINTSNENIKKQEPSKFKPIGPDANKFMNENSTSKTNENKENGEQDETEGKDEYYENQSESAQGQSNASQSGIEAAGFKKFIKKSISIKIKGNDQINRLDQAEKTIKDQNMLVKSKHISKIRQPSKANLDNVQNGGGNSTNASSEMINELADSETNSLKPTNQQSQQQLKTTPQTHYQQQQQQQQQESPMDKLRAQYNQHMLQNPNPNVNMNMMQHHPHNVMPAQRQLLPQPQSTIMGYNMSVPPPPTFAYPPPTLLAQQMSRPPNALLYPPPMHPQMQHIGMHQQPYPPQNTYLPNQPNMQQNAYIFHHHMATKNDNFNMNSKANDDEDVEGFNVNDDAAYDLDEDGNENLSDLDKSDQLNYDYNYDIDVDLNNYSDIISSKKNSKSSGKKHKHSSSRLKSQHDDSDEARDDNDDFEEQIFSSKRNRSKKAKSKGRNRSKNKSSANQSDQDDELGNQDLVGMKEMLKNILKMRIGFMENEQDEDFDEELKGTLESLLNQIVVDDGSLTLEDIENIQKTVLLLVEPDHARESDDNKYDSSKELKSGKKRRRAENNKNSENLTNQIRQSDDFNHKKKRKYQNNDTYSEKGSSKNKNSNYSSDIIEEMSQNAEVEAGEIDDVYDDVDVVEREFNDLLYNKK